VKIALVSTTLGRVLRGFESFTDSLFHSLRRLAPEVDVTLFAGGGQRAERRRVVPNLHRYDVPGRWLNDVSGDRLQNRSFALSLYPLLRLGKFDIVHYNELVMGSALFHLRRILGGTYKLLYCDGALAPPVLYHHRSDFAQTLTGPAYEDAVGFGVGKERLFLIPYGVDGNRFKPEESRGAREKIRSELGLPEKARVVLTVGRLDREVKRIDYVIREVSGLGDSVWLLAAGFPVKETPSLEKEAHRLLSGRCRFVSWPHQEVHRLYHAADVFALGSLKEAFGLVTVEAMLSGLPVIIHNGPVFKWIAQGTPVRAIDMSASGALSRTLKEFLSPDHFPSSREQAWRRFSWEALIPQYLDMYRQVMEGRPGGKVKRKGD
jgi:1,2-diacylglycerol 3-alpha-glucosyltransferase